LPSAKEKEREREEKAVVRAKDHIGKQAKHLIEHVTSFGNAKKLALANIK
jgi:hypothetical protein